MERLSDQEIDALRKQIDPRWSREGDALVLELELADFGAAIAMVDRIAEAAERANHHPDLLVHGYKRLRVTLSTHSAGGITERDFALARTIDAL